MKARGSYIQKLGHSLLNNELFSWLLIALLAVLPLASVVSLAVISLITLRKGWVSGFKALMVALGALCIEAQLRGSFAPFYNSILLTYAAGYLSAGILRQSASWRIVAGYQIIGALLGLLFVQLAFPELASNLYHFVLEMFKSIDAQGDIVKSLSRQSEQSQENMASYLLGIKAASTMFSASASVMVARSVQALMYNPGGFKQEMLAFRAPPFAAMLFILCIVGVYFNNSIMLSYFPVLFMYLVLAGISFGLHVLAQKRRLVVMLGMMVPIFWAPYIALPIYVALGSIDSVFNLRQCLLTYRGNNPNKG